MSTADTQSNGTVQETTAPGAAVFQAIQNANYKDEGAPFYPLLLKFAAASDLQNGWDSQRGETPISFFRSTGSSPADPFLPLGDVAVINNGDPSKAPVILVAPIPGQENTLAHPTGFNWILDDHGSGNSTKIAYYWPQAPAGYQALGVCLGLNGDTPNPANYWCVNSAILQDAPSKEFWSDSGQGWESGNGNLSAVDLTNIQAPEDRILLAPTTFLSDQQGGGPGQCLVLEKLMLPVAAVSAPDPVYSAETGVSDQTAPGLTSVAVLPCMGVVDSNGSGPGTDPFYYLASQPYWDCLEPFPSTAGGEIEVQFTIGTLSDGSQKFLSATSLAVGANVGVEAAPSSARLSVNYTHEMQVTEDRAASGSSIPGQESVTLPETQELFVWQQMIDIIAYRAEGNTEDGPTILSAATFQMESLFFTQSTP